MHVYGRVVRCKEVVMDLIEDGRRCETNQFGS